MGSAVIVRSRDRSSAKPTCWVLRPRRSESSVQQQMLPQIPLLHMGLWLGLVFFSCIVHPFYCVQIYVPVLRNCKLDTPESFPVLLDPPPPTPCSHFFINDFYSFPCPPLSIFSLGVPVTCAILGPWLLVCYV